MSRTKKSKIKPGDKVSYPIGRGQGQATVMSVEGRYATLQTANGKTLNRAVANLSPAPEGE